MIRLGALIGLLIFVSGIADAQQRARVSAQAERPGPGAAQCRIAEIALTRGGGGFVCDMGSDGRVFMATDGGTRPGGIAAFTAWLLEARNQPTARDFVTVNYEAADAATQAICDATGLRGTSARSPITCYKILAVID